MARPHRTSRLGRLHEGRSDSNPRGLGGHAVPRPLLLHHPPGLAVVRDGPPFSRQPPGHHPCLCQSRSVLLWGGSSRHRASSALNPIRARPAAPDSCRGGVPRSSESPSCHRSPLPHRPWRLATWLSRRTCEARPSSEHAGCGGYLKRPQVRHPLSQHPHHHPNHRRTPPPAHPQPRPRLPTPTLKPDPRVGSRCSYVSRHHIVGQAGFEPTTSSSRTRRATKLRHCPCAAPEMLAARGAADAPGPREAPSGRGGCAGQGGVHQAGQAHRVDGLDQPGVCGAAAG